MSKYRIINNGHGVFRVQKRFLFFFWRDLKTRYYHDWSKPNGVIFEPEIYFSLEAAQREIDLDSNIDKWEIIK